LDAHLNTKASTKAIEIKPSNAPKILHNPYKHIRAVVNNHHAIYRVAHE